jgi:hypothetical protein
MGIHFHDMPEDRLPADWHHGFRAKLRFLPKSRAFTTAKNDYFHGESMDDRANLMQSRRATVAIAVE